MTFAVFMKMALCAIFPYSNPDARLGGHSGYHKVPYLFPQDRLRRTAEIVVD